MKKYLLTLASLFSVVAFGQEYYGHNPAVLMYHDVVQTAAEANVSSDVTVAEFAKHLEYISSRHINVMSVEEYYKAYAQGLEPVERTVIFTFDDGYVGTFKNAVPLLEKYNMPATFFVHTNYVGVPGSGGTSRSHATWAELKKVDESPLFDIQSHTLTHPDLMTMGDDEVRSQFRDSQFALEQHLGGIRSFLAYPYGKYDQGIIRIAREYYSMAFTINDPNVIYDEAYQQPRLILNRGTASPNAFINALNNYFIGY